MKSGLTTPSCFMSSCFTSSFAQVLLEHHQIVRVRRIPPDADDVVADRHGEVDELALVVEALAADVLVPVVLGPRLLGFLKLPPDTVPANVRRDRAEPVVEHP